VDEHGLGPAAARDGAQLDRGRERRAAAPAQARFGDLLEQRRAGGWRDAVDGLVLGERDGAVGADAGEQARKAHATGLPETVPLTELPFTDRLTRRRTARPSLLPTVARRIVFCRYCTRPWYSRGLLGGPSVTALRSIRSPPPGSAAPPNRMRRMPSGAP